LKHSSNTVSTAKWFSTKCLFREKLTN